MLIQVLLNADCSAIDIVMSVKIIFQKFCAKNECHFLVKITQRKSGGSLDGWSISEATYIKNTA